MLLETADGPVDVEIEDIIKSEFHQHGSNDEASVTIDYIQHLENYMWKKTEVTVRKDRDFCQQLNDDVQQKVEHLEGRPKRLLVLINPVGGKKKSQKIYETVIEPLFKLAAIHTEVIVSKKSGHLVEVILSYDFSSVDGLVLLGGDGTFYECVNTLVKRTQQEAEIDYNDQEAVFKTPPLPVGIIPTGSGNGVALTCYGTRDCPATAALHIIKGTQRHFNLFKVFCDGKLLGTPGHVMSYGLFTDILHRIDSSRNTVTRIWNKICTLGKLIILNKQRVWGVEIQYKYKDSKTGDILSSEICGEYNNLASFVANMTTKAPFPPTFQMNGADDEVKLLLYRPSTRLEFMRLTKKAFNLAPDWMVSDSIDIYSVTEFKVKILGIDQYFEGEKSGQIVAEKLLSLDGDMAQMTTPEFEVKMLLQFLPVYASKP